MREINKSHTKWGCILLNQFLGILPLIFAIEHAESIDAVR